MIVLRLAMHALKLVKKQLKKAMHAQMRVVVLDQMAIVKLCAKIVQKLAEPA
jgi:hypothetical protein